MISTKGHIMQKLSLSLHVSYILFLLLFLTGCFENSDKKTIKQKEIYQIRLSQTSLELQEGNITSLHVKATYDKNSTQIPKSLLQWSATNPKIVSIQNNTLKALKEGETTIKARYKNLTSQSLHVRV